VGKPAFLFIAPEYSILRGVEHEPGFHTAEPPAKYDYSLSKSAEVLLQHQFRFLRLSAGSHYRSKNQSIEQYSSSMQSIIIQ
jgi:hypothetical protein